MSETSTYHPTASERIRLLREAAEQKDSLRISRKNKLARTAAAILIASGLGVALKKANASADPFHTDIAVPTQSQPHYEYMVKAGDTEGSIAAQYGHTDDMNYENMINVQLPKSDQHLRTLRPGEHLSLPKE